MKKLLIGLTILFSFLFINNVNAENIAFDKQHMFEYVTMTNTADLTNEEVIELLTNAGYADDQINKYIALRNYRIENNKDGKYYFLNPGEGVYFNNSRLMINLSNNAIQGYFTLHGSGTYYTIRYHIQVSSSSLSYYDAKIVDNVYSVYYRSTSSWVASQTNAFAYSLNSDNTINFNINSTHLNYFYETNMNIDFFYNGGDFTDDMIIGENTYPNGSTLPINSLNGYNSLINKEPQLEYKTGFISSEAYSVLGKVTNNFSIDSDLLEYRNYKFKLQFGSNDFTNENIPVFSHYKIFGLNRGTNNYESLDKYLNENLFTLDIIDTTYDYSEGMLADASIALQLNYHGSDEELEIFNTLYSQIKLEFYLDNTQNSYIYCYDNLLTSKWEDTSKFLENYIYYYFPSNYKYAFITSDNNINEGKIYFPTNSINNDLVKIQGQYYNIKNKIFSFPIITNLYLNDNYYSYFDFYFNDTENILLLNRAVGSYNYESWYNPTFLEHWYESIFIDYISISEDTYFYVPIGYNVYFTNNTNISINTSNGNIDIDIENSKNDYENNIYNENITSNSFFELFIKSFNFFITPINSLFSLISLFFGILPLGIQYMFYVSFGFIIALLIYKFVL